LFSWLGKTVSGQIIDVEYERALKATGKLFIILLLGVLYFTGVKVLGGFIPKFTQNPEAMSLLVQGGFALNFWIGEVGLAVLLPLLLILVTGGRNPKVLALAGLSCLIGVFVLFYDLVIVGQLIPHYHQYNVVGLPKYYSYSPSLHEIMITIGAIFSFFAAFVLGEMIFKKISIS